MKVPKQIDMSLLLTSTQGNKCIGGEISCNTDERINVLGNEQSYKVKKIAQIESRVCMISCTEATSLPHLYCTCLYFILFWCIFKHSSSSFYCRK